MVQKCNRLWPLSKWRAVKTTFRHKSDEKEANESFCWKTFSFQASDKEIFEILGKFEEEILQALSKAYCIVFDIEREKYYCGQNI